MSPYRTPCPPPAEKTSLNLERIKVIILVASVVFIWILGGWREAALFAYTRAWVELAVEWAWPRIRT